jgi:hypothetical protein
LVLAKIVVARVAIVKFGKDYGSVDDGGSFEVGEEANVVDGGYGKSSLRRGNRYVGRMSGGCQTKKQCCEPLKGGGLEYRRVREKDWRFYCS